MPIPALRIDGTLPPGIHVATLDEVLAAYPPTTLRRQELNDELIKLIGICQALPAARELVVDGSYVTDALEPGDIDVAILYDESEGIVTVERLKAAGIDTDNLVDAWVETHNWYQKWITFLQMTIDDSQTGQPGYAKGIIRIIC